MEDFLKAFPDAKGKITFTDDLPSYAAVLPQGAHFTGKSLTQKLESLNANVRHRLARFARRTRCTTKCTRMAYLSALLFMQAHNNELIERANAGGFSGINVDYQGVPIDKAAQFVTLLTELEAALEAEGLSLAVTLAAPTLSNGNWNSGGHDWA